MKTLWNNEKGMILIWFYLLIAILLVSGGALYGLSFQESRLMGIEQGRNKSFYLAEAGLDRKLQEMKTGNLNSITNAPLGEGNYSVRYCPSTPLPPPPPPVQCPAVSPCE